MKSKQQILVTVISFLLVLLFTYAGISKLMNYHHFIGQLKSSPLLKPGAGILVWLIPCVEFYAVILLLVREWKKAGLVMSSVLMLLFTGYIAIMLLFFETIPCSCGGVLQSLTWHQHLLFNIFFLLLALAGVIITHKEKNQGCAND